MAEPIAVFARVEKKYLLTGRQVTALMERIGGYLKPDEYGEYTVCNVYFDTDTYELIRTSLEKPVYKEKLRLRSYGVPGENDRVFLELKKKYKGIVYKRRTTMTRKEADAYIQNGTPPTEGGQIFREIDFAMRRYRPTPKLYLAYDRRAFSGKDIPGLRLTLDSHIRFRTYNVRLSAGDAGEQILPEDQYLMELKIPGAMPLWLSQALSELSIFPTSFSKYGRCYEQLCAAEESRLTG